MAVSVRLAGVADAPAIARIHNEGIEDRIATFETEARTADQVAKAQPDGHTDSDADAHAGGNA